MAPIRYDSPNANGWRNCADDLFLAQFRGLPCMICGETHSVIKGTRTRSCGHHAISKELCRAHRYNKRNIVILCPEHHTRFTGNISPHSENSVEVGLFYEWLTVTKPNRWEWVKLHYQDKADKTLTYMEAYLILGGEITDTKFKKDQKPLNHAKHVREAENDAK